MNCGGSIQISSLYRSHNLHKAEFISNLKKTLIQNNKIKNHYIARDFNIDILEINNISEEFLNNFLEMGFKSGYQNITRPPNDDLNSRACIDNIF